MNVKKRFSKGFMIVACFAYNGTLKTQSEERNINS